MECEDNNYDTLEVIESIVFNQKVVNVRAINENSITDIILSKQKAKDLGNILLQWSEEMI